MARDRLTALHVKRAHEKGLPVMLPDAAGLYLRKQSASGTAWTLRYRFGGRDRWMALGSYPDMELADARKAARAKRTLVDAGRDPLLEKQSEIDAQLKASAAKKARGKLKELAEDWYETEIKGGRLKHPAVPRRYLDKYMLPELAIPCPPRSRRPWRRAYSPAWERRRRRRRMICCATCGVFLGSPSAGI
jgi:hypothetical protein